jgi:hypothetical protein
VLAAMTVRRATTTIVSGTFCRQDRSDENEIVAYSDCSIGRGLIGTSCKEVSVVEGSEQKYYTLILVHYINGDFLV